MQALRNDSQAKNDLPLTQGELFAEYAPGVYTPLVSPVHIPSYVISKLMPQGDGTYRLEPAYEWTGWVKLHDIASSPDMPDLSWQTLRRLALGGFINGMQPTPGIWWIQLDSLFEHLERTKCDDPDDSWWTEERKQAWAAAR